MSIEQQVLRAGDWEAALASDGALSRIRVRGVEVLHGLMVVVRDDAWGTVPATVDIHSVEQGDNGFVVEFSAVHDDGHVRFDWHGSVVGAPDGITAVFDGTVRRDFRSNRIGFVALHPLLWSGAPVSVRHPDGSTTDSSYPETVSPDQPFLDVAGFRQSIEGGTVTLEFSGDTFETEDQRNWSDASYKTYSRPLALPFPVSRTAGRRCGSRCGSASRRSSRIGLQPPSARLAPRWSCASGGGFRCRGSG